MVILNTAKISYIGMMNNGIGWNFKKEDEKNKKKLGFNFTIETLAMN